MNNNIENRLATLEESLKGLSLTRQKKVVSKEVVFLKGSYSINYVTRIVTFYRSRLKDSYPNLMPFITVGRRAVMSRKKKYRGDVVKRSSNMKPIHNIDGMIDKAIELLGSERYTDIVIGLALLTGRRLGEILKTAKFTNVGKKKYMLYFEGQLKKKGDAKKYQIYSIGNTAKICKIALKKIRLAIDAKNMTNFEVTRKYNKAINDRVTLHFGQYIGRCSVHDLRAVYAAFCCAKYCPKTVNENVFIGGILGHNWDDIDVANSYKKYIIQ